MPSAAERSGTAHAPALVTGASSGIGAAVAVALAEVGHPVALFGRDRERLDRIAARVEAAGAPAHVAAVDLRDGAALATAIDAAEAALGTLGVVVNAAGIAQRAPTPLETFDTDEWYANIDTNLHGTYLVCRALIGRFKARGAGAIVNIGSTGSHRSMPGNAAYAASKFAVRALTEALVEECEGSGVHVHLVSPGPVDTAIWNAKDELPSDAFRGTMLRPRDIADIVLWLLSRPARVRIDEVLVRPRRLPDDPAV